MHTWTKMRKKLETEYLAESLRGHLTYFVTNYHKMHDGDEGRVAIRLDGEEILKSNFFERMGTMWDLYYRKLPQDTDDSERWRQAGLETLRTGEFYQNDLYRAFQIYDNQSISESLASENALVQMLALLDRRTGKRTLEKLRQPMQEAPQWLQMIYCVRLLAEQMPLPEAVHGQEKRMKKGILFDLDGTLWDSSGQVIAAWNKCIREELGRPEQFTVADMRGFMGKTLDVIAGMMFPDEPPEEQLRLIRACSKEEYAYLETHHAVIYERVKETLTALAKDHTLGIVSNCQDGYIQIFLRQSGFAELFTDFECAGRTGGTKGQNIRLVMERNGITECVYVGDTQGDADAAKEAGIPFIHAAYGFGTADVCAAALQDISELPEAAETIFSKG